MAEHTPTSILNAIGNTPLVEIRRLSPNPRVRIFAKLEYFNPGGSVKDRIALAMIEAGECSGALTPDKTVIEATSGNTGIGLAMVCAVKGYKLLLAMSEAVSVERRKILKARGAEIMLTPGHLGTDGAIEEVYRLVREQPEAYFMTDQYNNEANWKAHYEGTGPEIWRQTNGKVTCVVATIGTSGTVMGLSRRMKAYNDKIKVVGVEPFLGHKIQGLKNMKEAYRPEIFEKHLLDHKVNVEDEAAFAMTRRLAKVEGLLVGMSSGAAMVAALQQAERMHAGTLVVVLPDSGERYLSTTLFAEAEPITVKFYNTLTRRKEPFEPQHPGKASLYSCGPTAHAPLHLGECRRFVFSDLLYRYLVYRGYEVNHVMNITDLDDKTISGSEKAQMPLSDFTDAHIDAFRQDLDHLNITSADTYPRASAHVNDMVRLAEKLAQKGFAYEKLRSLYFDISRFEDYGKLSGIDLDKIRIGATVDLDEYEKDNPRDFTLFKRSRLSELKRGHYVKTPWGSARPSWHIQCAAMAMKYLGDSYDIHTGGRELTFPHHENEIAIAAAATGKKLAAYWLHVDQVLMDGKMMDERGQTFTLRELDDAGFSGREIRYWLLATHYRKALIFSLSRLEDGRRALKRLDGCIFKLLQVRQGNAYPDVDQLVYNIKQQFSLAMDDDLNVAAAMASVFKNVRRINKLLQEDQINASDALKIIDAFKQLNRVLDIFRFEVPACDEDIADLHARRREARLAGDWALADDLRRQLLERGEMICDASIAPLGKKP